MDLKDLMNMDESLTQTEKENAESQRLIRQVEHLSDLCRALYECLSDAGIDNTIILSKLAEVNSRTHKTSPAADNILTECHSCGKLVSSRHSYCTHCGTRLIKSFIL